MKRMAVLRFDETGEELVVVRQIRDKLIPMLRRQAECYRGIVEHCPDHGIALRRWDELTPSQREEAGRYFESSVSPAHAFSSLIRSIRSRFSRTSPLL